MSEDPQAAIDQWREALEQFNEVTLDGLEGALEEGSAVTEAWLDAVDGQTPADLDTGVDPDAAVAAYAVWIDAAERLFERVQDAMEGEDVDPEELRDIWLEAANEAFSEVMGTSAFAAATGETIASMLDAQEATDDATHELAHAAGLAARDDIREVGERLVELERRQQTVEEKLDRVLDAIEAE